MPSQTIAHVGVEHPVAAVVGLDPDGLEGLVGRALGPKPIAGRQEVGLEHRFQDQPRRVIATRSRTVGMPSGRVLPGWPGLGMWTRRSGAGR
jgi:hypothetical protein